MTTTTATSASDLRPFELADYLVSLTEVDALENAPAGFAAVQGLEYDGTFRIVLADGRVAFVRIDIEGLA